ncbi:MAG TPA: DUF4259 domain-containing protein [Gemmatimonadaceae bacterium]
MGILGADPFENDDAREWLESLDVAAGSAPLVEMLRRIVDGASDPHLDVRRSTLALAAAELLAALHRRPADALPRAGQDWVAGVSGGDAAGSAPDEEALALATRALDFVVTSSALAELWSQRDDADRWRARLDDLRLRLSL